MERKFIMNKHNLKKKRYNQILIGQGTTLVCLNYSVRKYLYRSSHSLRLYGSRHTLRRYGSRHTLRLSMGQLILSDCVLDTPFPHCIRNTLRLCMGQAIISGCMGQPYSETVFGTSHTLSLCIGQAMLSYCIWDKPYSQTGTRVACMRFYQFYFTSFDRNVCLCRFISLWEFRITLIIFPIKHISTLSIRIIINSQ